MSQRSAAYLYAYHIPSSPAPRPTPSPTAVASPASAAVVFPPPGLLRRDLAEVEAVSAPRGGRTAGQRGGGGGGAYGPCPNHNGKKMTR